MLALEEADEVVPDLPAAFEVEGWVVEGELDAGLEGFVEDSDWSLLVGLLGICVFFLTFRTSIGCQD